MKLTRSELSAEDFRALDEDVRIFLVQLGHLLNEVNILRKCVLICSEKNERTSGIERSAQVLQALFFIRTLAGKLCEGRLMLEKSYFKKRLGKRFGVGAEAESALKQLKQYFGNKNLIDELRNKRAFHYDRDIVRKSFDAALRSSRLWLVSGGTRVTDLFLFADDLINWSIVKEMGLDSDQAAMDKLVKEVSDVAGWLQEFGYGFIQELFRAESVEFRTQEQEVREVKLDDASLPYFIVD